MKTLTVDLPDLVDIDLYDLKIVLATNLYRTSRLSLGQAASLLGISKRTFMETLGHFNVSIFDNDIKFLEEDFSNA
jgi:predicted HTH domain antitoxin